MNLYIIQDLNLKAQVEFSYPIQPGKIENQTGDLFAACKEIVHKERYNFIHGGGSPVG